MKAKEIRDKYKNEMGVSYKDNDSKIRLGYIYWLENKVEEYSQLQTRALIEKYEKEVEKLQGIKKTIDVECEFQLTDKIDIYLKVIQDLK